MIGTTKDLKQELLMYGGQLFKFQRKKPGSALFVSSNWM